MNEYELGSILRQMYENAPDGRKATMIHLFGIKYANELREDSISIAEVIKHSEIKASYQVEVNKGINLAEYVSVHN